MHERSPNHSSVCPVPAARRLRAHRLPANRSARRRWPSLVRFLPSVYAADGAGTQITGWPALALPSRNLSVWSVVHVARSFTAASPHSNPPTRPQARARLGAGVGLIRPLSIGIYIGYGPHLYHKRWVKCGVWRSTLEGGGRGARGGMRSMLEGGGEGGIRSMLEGGIPKFSPRRCAPRTVRLCVRTVRNLAANISSSLAPLSALVQPI